MVYQSRIKNATRRTTLVLVFLCLCGINTFAADDATAITLAIRPAWRHRARRATAAFSFAERRSQRRHVAGD